MGFMKLEPEYPVMSAVRAMMGPDRREGGPTESEHPPTTGSGVMKQAVFGRGSVSKLI